MNRATTLPTDEQLCEATRRGDREAFDTVVRRYQTLLCSLAFSRTGNLAAAQDLAQETFLAAWRRMGELREPSQLRPWLCGILRNLSANSARRSRRRGETVPLPEEVISAEDGPEARAVTREEELLLWGALGEMPEEYREPLILFYREERSVAEVAAQLDLSEDAAKQRLSRGRAMLRGRMEEVVESALARSKPKAGFATGVLAALAVSSPGQATAAGMAVAGGGAGAAVTAAMVAGPAAGLSVAWLASVAVGRNAHSEEERRIVRAAFGRAIRFCVPMVFVLVMLLPLLLLLRRVLLLLQRAEAVGCCCAFGCCCRCCCRCCCCCQ